MTNVATMGVVALISPYNLLTWNWNIFFVDADCVKPKMLQHQTSLVRKTWAPTHVDAIVYSTEDEYPRRHASSFSKTHDASLKPMFLHLTKYLQYSLFWFLLLTLFAKTWSNYSVCLTCSCLLHSTKVFY
jgi:hypothetical protein